jgi:hypothetical protein
MPDFGRKFRGLRRKTAGPNFLPVKNFEKGLDFIQELSDNSPLSPWGG